MHVSGSCSQRRDSTECCVAVIVTMFLVPGLVASLYTLLQLWSVATAPCPVPQCGATLSDTTQQPCISFFIIQHSPPTKHQCFNTSLHFQRIINIATTSAEWSASAQLRGTKRGENSWWNILTDWSTYASHWHYKVDQLVKQTSNVREKLLREWLQVISRWPQ